ncbi:MAG: hypothetical protein NC453_11440 [Muribaculum sp.]|nr:hypothetical protein [Muribaculum sp.]
MSALQNLEELFVKYQRLNQILKDNWNDTTQEAFDGNYLTPILTEWSQYHSYVTDMKTRFDSTRRELEQDMDAIDRECNEILDSDDCRLNGCSIYGACCHRDGYSMTRHIIVDAGESNHLDKDDLRFMVMGRFPSVDDVDKPFLEDTISIY